MWQNRAVGSQARMFAHTCVCIGRELGNACGLRIHPSHTNRPRNTYCAPCDTMRSFMGFMAATRLPSCTGRFAYSNTTTLSFLNRVITVQPARFTLHAKARGVLCTMWYGRGLRTDSHAQPKSTQANYIGVPHWVSARCRYLRRRIICKCSSRYVHPSRSLSHLARWAADIDCAPSIAVFLRRPRCCSRPPPSPRARALSASMQDLREEHVQGVCTGERAHMHALILLGPVFNASGGDTACVLTPFPPPLRSLAPFAGNLPPE